MKSRKKLSLKRLENSKPSIRRGRMLHLNHGSRKLGARLSASNKRIKLSITHEQSVNNK